MVRAALEQRRRLNRGPRTGVRFIPALSVVAASLLAALPIVSQSGYWPDFGLLMLISWRLLRADVWPAWWAAPLGFVNDVLTGQPVGLSVVLWTSIMLAMDLVDRRTQWRDYWVEWALAAIIVLAAESAEWKVAAWGGAPLPFVQMIPGVLIGILTFPLFAYLAGKLDRWRLGQ